MACGLKICLMVFVVCNIEALVDGAPQVPCYFIFGDSLVDSGNNNVLKTLAKANNLPYGVDFPGGPTGRFCNGRNIADIIAEHLGFDSHIQPFVTAQGEDILNGVNYGSGGSGILNETGQQLGARISLGGQLENHQTTISKISTILGNNQSATEHLNKCLYSVGMGSNDYINNYFMPEHYNTSRQHNPNQYASLLIQQYSLRLRALYNYGARKVVLFALGLIGCAPYELKRNIELPCVPHINLAVDLFNNKLKVLVDNLNQQLAGAKFIYVNTTGISITMPFGFRVTNAPCCTVSTGIGEGQCLSQQDPCPNRNEYVFFDAFHPTEAANVIMGGRAYNSQYPFDTYPIDIRGLVQL